MKAGSLKGHPVAEPGSGDRTARSIDKKEVKDEIGSHRSVHLNPKVAQPLLLPLIKGKQGRWL